MFSIDSKTYSDRDGKERMKTEEESLRQSSNDWWMLIAL